MAEHLNIEHVEDGPCWCHRVASIDPSTVRAAKVEASPLPEARMPHGPACEWKWLSPTTSICLTHKSRGESV